MKASVEERGGEVARRVPAALQTLKRLYEVTNDDIAEALGLTGSAGRSWVQERVSGKTPCKPVELAALASAFGVDVAVLFMEKDEVRRWVVDHGSTDAELRLPCIAA